jgi:hypothetical protein
VGLPREHSSLYFQSNLLFRPCIIKPEFALLINIKAILFVWGVGIPNFSEPKRK